MPSNSLKIRLTIAAVIILLLIGLYEVLLHSQLLSHEAFCMAVSVICIGFISIGTIENNFTKKEGIYFWKILFLACNVLCVLPLVFRTCLLFFFDSGYRYLVSTIYIRDTLLLYLTFVVIFLTACVVGMLINLLTSYLAGFFLMVSHIGSRIWYRIQHKGNLSVIKTPLIFEINFRMKFSYYASEFFIAASWFVILISSSIASPNQLWNFIFGQIGWFLLPLWAVICLLLQYELIGIKWGSKDIKPELFHKFFSHFAVISFIIKLLMYGTNHAAITEIFIMLYILLLISCSFAIGFMASSKIVAKRAIKEIVRVGKLYAWITCESPR